VFPGGSLEELKKIKPDLRFKELVITGQLVLPYGAGVPTTRISATKLTVTPEGSINTDFGSPCEWTHSADLELEASGDVVIDGKISLKGRNGMPVTAGATCNQCDGQRGGNLSITGNTVKVSSAIDNSGGLGMWTDYGGGVRVPSARRSPPRAPGRHP